MEQVVLHTLVYVGVALKGFVRLDLDCFVKQPHYLPRLTAALVHAVHHMCTSPVEQELDGQ